MMCHFFSVGDTPNGTARERVLPSVQSLTRWCWVVVVRVGNWTANPTNPVVTGGELWSRICSRSGAHCSTGTVDEGTPDIIWHDHRDGTAVAAPCASRSGRA